MIDDRDVVTTYQYDHIVTQMAPLVFDPNILDISHCPIMRQHSLLIMMLVYYGGSLVCLTLDVVL
jgi:hypothetical protein